MLSSVLRDARRLSRPALVTLTYRRALPPRSAVDSPIHDDTNPFFFQTAKGDIHRGWGDLATGAPRDFVDDRHAVDVLAKVKDGEQDHLLEFAEGVAHHVVAPIRL